MLQWERGSGSKCQECVMGQALRTGSPDRVRLARLALLAFVSATAALQAPNCTAKDAKQSAATLALPDRPAEVAPFMAGMDDQQARATLARLLEERTREPKPERGREMLMDLEHASGMLGGRLRNITEAKGEVAAAPRIYWQWLTGDGSRSNRPPPSSGVGRTTRGVCLARPGCRRCPGNESRRAVGNGEFGCATASCGSDDAVPLDCLPG